MIRGFVPLGEFLVKKPGEWPEASLEQARGYVKRLRLAHVHVEPFVARALGEKQTAAGGKKRKRSPGEEGDGEETREETALPDVAAEGGVSEDDKVPAGRVVWAPWLLGRGPPRRARVFWPAPRCTRTTTATRSRRTPSTRSQRYSRSLHAAKAPPPPTTRPSAAVFSLPFPLTERCVP